MSPGVPFPSPSRVRQPTRNNRPQQAGCFVFRLNVRRCRLWRKPVAGDCPVSGHAAQAQTSGASHTVVSENNAMTDSVKDGSGL